MDLSGTSDPPRAIKMIAEGEFVYYSTSSASTSVIIQRMIWSNTTPVWTKSASCGGTCDIYFSSIDIDSATNTAYAMISMRPYNIFVSFSITDGTPGPNVYTVNTGCDRSDGMALSGDLLVVAMYCSNHLLAVYNITSGKELII